MLFVTYARKYDPQAMPYMVTLIIIEALINWLGRGHRSVAAHTMEEKSGKYVKMSANVCKNACKYVQICTNMCKYVQMCTNMCKYMQKCLQMFENMCKYVQKCTNMCKYVQAQYCRQCHEHLLWTRNDHGWTFQQGMLDSLYMLFMFSMLNPMKVDLIFGSSY